MGEQELRELDAWIAEHGLGIEVKWVNGVPVRKEDEVHTWGAGMGLVFNNIPSYTSRAFREVKREIERRGWSWESQYISRARMDIRYRFTVFTENWESDGCVNASSEELAGCLAFKAAVEATETKAVALGDVQPVTIELDENGERVVGSVVRGKGDVRNHRIG